MSKFSIRPKPLVLISISGFGVGQPSAANAIESAETPNLDSLWQDYPHGILRASGEHVGLPKGMAGNEYSGTLTIEAGRPIFDEQLRIDNSIKTKTFLENRVLIEAIKEAEKFNKNIHVIGTLDRRKREGCLAYFGAMIEICKKEKFDGNSLYFHVILTDASTFEEIEELEELIEKTQYGNVTTVIGSKYALNEENGWNSNLQAYELFTQNKGKQVKHFRDIFKKVKKGSDLSNTEAHVVLNYDEPFPNIEKQDTVIFALYRGIGSAKLARLFDDEELKEVQHQKVEKISFIGFAEFDTNFPKKTAYPRERITNSLVSILSDNGFAQLRIAGKRNFDSMIAKRFRPSADVPYPGESQLEVEDEDDINDKIKALIIERSKTGNYDFIFANFAKVDEIAHTGNIDNTVREIEKIDATIKEIVEEIIAMNGAVIITSDHGNAESMMNYENEIDSHNTVNPVPIWIIDQRYIGKELPFGSLADIAPTVLGMLGISKPANMTGRSLM